MRSTLRFVKRFAGWIVSSSVIMLAAVPAAFVSILYTFLKTVCLAEKSRVTVRWS